jgi:hypothetical protein
MLCVDNTSKETMKKACSPAFCCFDMFLWGIEDFLAPLLHDQTAPVSPVTPLCIQVLAHNQSPYRAVMLLF